MVAKAKVVFDAYKFLIDFFAFASDFARGKWVLSLVHITLYDYLINETSVSLKPCSHSSVWLPERWSEHKSKVLFTPSWSKNRTNFQTKRKRYSLSDNITFTLAQCEQSSTCIGYHLMFWFFFSAGSSVGRGVSGGSHVINWKSAELHGGRKGADLSAS